MSNYQVEPASKPQALSKEAIKALRHEQVQGLSRRQILRGSIAGAMLLWITEVAAGSLGFLWPNLSGGFGGQVRIGTLEDVKLANSDVPIEEGFPGYYPDARAYVVLIDPAVQQFLPGASADGDGTQMNVRGLYQRCPHLGCRPNPCERNFWMECPCHGSRYDRLGIKAEGSQFGPAARGMDRFAITVEADGTLVLDTSKITLGPNPITVGQPGIIPPKSPVGCI